MAAPFVLPPCTAGGLGGFCEYEVEIQKAEGAKVGIDVDTDAYEVQLLITLVKEGLVAEWNKRNPAARVEPGHRIVEVNGVAGSAAQLKAEVKRCSSLRLKRRRSPRPAGLVQSCLSTSGSGSHGIFR